MKHVLIFEKSEVEGILTKRIIEDGWSAKEFRWSNEGIEINASCNREMKITRPAKKTKSRDLLEGEIRSIIVSWFHGKRNVFTTKQIREELTNRLDFSYDSALFNSIIGRYRNKGILENVARGTWQIKKMPKEHQ